MAALDVALGEAELVVLFQYARMDGERTRGGAGSCVPVDDAERHALSRQAIGQSQAGGARSDD